MSADEQAGERAGEQAERPLRVAYLGPPGTFSEHAAVLYAPDAELIERPTISTAAEAPARGEADWAIVPFENSIAGSIGETHDLIIHHLNLRIRGELILPIEHCLILPAAAPAATIGLIISHPQPLAQCHLYLQRRFPDVRTEATLSTAEAVGRAMELGAGAAAIGPRRAAEVYGAHIAEAGIEDDRRNATRFVVLAHEDHRPTGNDKTTLVFSTANRPGALLRALQHFADRGINLTRIESRPARERLGVYLFIVDCDGHREDPELAGALLDLRQDLERLHVVGSYPRAEPAAG